MGEEKGPNSKSSMDFFVPTELSLPGTFAPKGSYQGTLQNLASFC